MKNIIYIPAILLLFGISLFSCKKHIPSPVFETVDGSVMSALNGKTGFPGNHLPETAIKFKSSYKGNIEALMLINPSLGDRRITHRRVRNHSIITSTFMVCNSKGNREKKLSVIID